MVELWLPEWTADFGNYTGSDKDYSVFSLFNAQSGELRLEITSTEKDYFKSQKYCVHR